MVTKTKNIAQLTAQHGERQLQDIQYEGKQQYQEIEAERPESEMHK